MTVSRPVTVVLLDLSGTQLLGLGFAALGLVIVGFTGRYVWRATGIWRGTAVDSLARTAPGSLVRVRGTVQRGSDEFLRGPFSGTECQAIRYQLEERRLSPVLLPWYVTLNETAGSVPFRVRTAADEVDILPVARSVLLDRRVVETVPAGETPPEPIRRFERDADLGGIASRWRNPPAVLGPIIRVLSLGTRRYVEQCVGTGAEVTVVGRVTDRGDAVDPVVVSDRSPLATVLGMAKPSLVGFAVGAGAIAVGLVLFAVG